MWNVAARLSKRSRWCSAALLGALLVLPAELARADTPRESARESSGSRSSGSSAKASSSSSSRSAPRARSAPRSSSRGAPKASSRSRSSSRSQPRASSRSQSPRRSSVSRERPSRSSVSRERPARDSRAVSRERPGRREVDGRKPDLRQEINHKELENPSPASPAGRRPHDRPRDPYYGGHHHRHYYGCGHYGYGYDSYYWSGYGYWPHSYWGLGYWGSNYYWAPEVHVYGGGGGGYSSYGDYGTLGQGALDLDLRPDRAEVYVDGIYVGVADQFDGHPTHLWLDEGTYELAFYLDGYETIVRQYTIYPGVTVKVDDRMRRGQAMPPAGPIGDLYPAPGDSAAPRPETRPPAAPSNTGDGGRIVIAASPGDAAVYLDGHFVGTAEEIGALGTGLIVEPGDHVVEIIRPGYQSQRVPVSVAAGERLEVELDLRR